MSETYNVDYWPNGNIKNEEWRDEKGRYYRENGPAFITYYDNGKIRYEDWNIDYKWHRLDGPARIWYDTDDLVNMESYFIDGQSYSKEKYYNHPEVIEYKLNQLINQQLA